MLTFRRVAVSDADAARRLVEQHGDEIEFVDTTEAVFLAAFSKPCDCRFLRGVTLRECRGGELAEALRLHTGIQEVALDYCGCRLHTGIQDMALDYCGVRLPIRSCVKACVLSASVLGVLRSLTLKVAYVYSTELVGALGAATGLEQLCCEVGDGPFEQLAGEVSRLTRLQRLEIVCRVMKADALSHMLMTLTGLTRLGLQGGNARFDVEADSFVRLLKLEVLELDYWNSNRNLEKLKLQGLPRLRALLVVHWNHHG